MKKRTLSLLLLLALVLSLPAAAAVTRNDVVAVLKQRVDAYMAEIGYTYQYDTEQERYDLEFELVSQLKSSKEHIFLYNDLLAVTALADITVPPRNRDKVAVLLSLINYDIYYAHFNLEYQSGTVLCYASQYIGSVLPGQEEIDMVVQMPLNYLNDYGDAIARVALRGADPHQVYADAKAALEERP